MKNQTSKQGLVGLLASAVIALGTLGISGCTSLNPIDSYKTLTARAALSNLYDKNKKIDMNKLDEYDSKHLKKMHEKYGEGEIDYMKLSDEIDPKSLNFFRDLTGHKKFTDEDLILIYRVQKDLAYILTPGY